VSNLVPVGNSRLFGVSVCVCSVKCVSVSHSTNIVLNQIFGLNSWVALIIKSSHPYFSVKTSHFAPMLVKTDQAPLTVDFLECAGASSNMRKNI